MRTYRSNDFRPFIFDAVSKYKWGVTSLDLPTEGRNAAIAKVSLFSWQRFKTQFWGWLILWLSAFAAYLALKNGLHLPKYVGLIIFLGSIANISVLYALHVRSFTLKELEAMSPLLNLTDVERAYFGATLATLESRTLVDEDQTRARHSLNQLMEKVESLQLRISSIKESSLEPKFQPAQRDLDDLQAKLSEAGSDEAKATLGEAISVAKRRVQRTGYLSEELDFLEAKIELARQAFLSFSEELRSEVTGYKPELRETGIESILNSIQTQTLQAAAAMDEIRNLDLA